MEGTIRLQSQNDPAPSFQPLIHFTPKLLSTLVWRMNREGRAGGRSIDRERERRMMDEEESPCTAHLVQCGT